MVRDAPLSSPRYEREGPESLEDRARRPNNWPWAAEPVVIEEAIPIRKSRCKWVGARKVRPQLVKRLPDRQVASERTRLSWAYFRPLP